MIFRLMRFVLMLAPLLAFLAWLAFHAYRTQRITEEQYARYRRILLWIGVGMALAILGMWAATLLFEPSTPMNMEYVPPRQVNGAIIPGHLEKPSGE